MPSRFNTRKSASFSAHGGLAFSILPRSRLHLYYIATNSLENERCEIRYRSK